MDISCPWVRGANGQAEKRQQRTSSKSPSWPGASATHSGIDPFQASRENGVCEQISHCLDLMHLHSDTSENSMTGFSIYALKWPLSSINQIWSHCKQSSFLIFSCHKCKKKKLFPTIWDGGVLFKTYRFSCAECLCLKSQHYEAEAGGLLCLWLDLDTEWVLVSK